jgi:hypothetical protein
LHPRHYAVVHLYFLLGHIWLRWFWTSRMWHCCWAWLLKVSWCLVALLLGLTSESIMMPCGTVVEPYFWKYHDALWHCCWAWLLKVSWCLHLQCWDLQTQWHSVTS